MGDYSEAILRRDIHSLIRGQAVAQPDLSMYTRIARNPVRAIPTTPHPYVPFMLTPNLHRRRSLTYSITMFAAVSKTIIRNDTDRLRDLMGSWCGVINQERGRFGVVTNARAKLDEDASSLIGALLYTLEYSYDAQARILTPLNCGVDEDAPGLVINTFSTERKAADVLLQYSFTNADEIISGSTPMPIKEEFAGMMGVKFSEGAPLLIECVAAADFTVYVGMYNSAMYDALEQVRALQLCLAYS